MPETARTETELIAPDLEMNANVTLDPSDWESFRKQSHGMLDDMLDYIQNIRRRPVWQPMPEQLRARYGDAVPRLPSCLATVHEEFMRDILPFTAGNVHPGFMGWVQGGGTPVGMLADMLAAGLNANVGGRNQAPIEVERQVGQWMREIFGFPQTATGLFVTGTSMANLIAVLIARDVALGFEVRGCGIARGTKRLVAYASKAVHCCIPKALDISGLGSDALRLVPTDDRHRIDLAALEEAIEKDRRGDITPFLIVGTAGTVDTGAVDDLAGIADLCKREKIWFHVDGAYGALAMLAPDLAPKLKGIERADSLAFDFHKWAQVPYDAGYILVRDGTLHKNTFSSPAAYLERTERGLAANSPWPCDFGPDLSRGFRALKTWMTLKVYGTKAIGEVISRTCDLARYLESRIAASPELELMAPVELNIVCFRYRLESPGGAETDKLRDRLNREIVIRLQEAGAVAPSTTTVGGRAAIRAAIVNHRTGRAEIDALVDGALSLGRTLKNSAHQSKFEPTTQEFPEQLSGQLHELHSQQLSKQHSEQRIDRLSEQVSVQHSERADVQPAPQAVHKPAEPPTDVVGLLFKRANILRLMGQDMEARKGYLEVLHVDPSHAGALNNLGNLFMAAGEKEEARRVYAEALAKHPQHPLAHVNLAILLLQTKEFEKAREHFEQALKLDPYNLQAHIGLSFVLENLGDPKRALRHRRIAFEGRCIIPAPYRGKQPPITVLELSSSPEGNSRLGEFLSDQIFKKYVVITEFYDSRTPLPPHQLIVNAIGDAEVAATALVGAQSLLAHSAAPVINAPSAVLATGRCEIARRISKVPGVITPRTVTLSRESLVASDYLTTLGRHGFEFPFLLRSLGFHGGEHFLRVENCDELTSALVQLPGRDLTVIQYLDARAADGKTHKYRVMMVGGQLYPLHAAISSDWKVHYFSAQMAAYPEHRAQDAAFLANMHGVIGPSAMRALEEIQKTLGLDYGGVDFGLNEKGELLLFEANATMVVARPGADECWDYRRPAVERICKAVLKMLIDRANTPSHRRNPALPVGA